MRWLIAAPISAAPGGRTLDLIDVLDQLGFTATVDLGPAIGAAAALPTMIAFPRLRAFSLATVLAAAPPLAELKALSERIGGSPSKRPTPTELLAAVARVGGEGPLHAALAALLTRALTPNLGGNLGTPDARSWARQSLPRWCVGSSTRSAGPGLLLEFHGNDASPTRRGARLYRRRTVL